MAAEFIFSGTLVRREGQEHCYFCNQLTGSGEVSIEVAGHALLHKHCWQRAALAAIDKFLNCEPARADGDWR